MAPINMGWWVELRLLWPITTTTVRLIPDEHLHCEKQVGWWMTFKHGQHHKLKRYCTFSCPSTCKNMLMGWKACVVTYHHKYGQADPWWTFSLWKTNWLVNKFQAWAPSQTLKVLHLLVPKNMGWTPFIVTYHQNHRQAGPWWTGSNKESKTKRLQQSAVRSSQFISEVFNGKATSLHGGGLSFAGMLLHSVRLSSSTERIQARVWGHQRSQWGVIYCQ